MPHKSPVYGHIFALMGLSGAQKPVRFAPLEELTPFFSTEP
jgi:hypothetical protein